MSLFATILSKLALDHKTEAAARASASELLVIGGLPLAIQGDWILPVVKAESHAFVKRHSSGFIVDARIMGEQVIGGYHGKVKGAYSGALVVAQEISTCVVYQQLEDGRYWVMAARDGMPLANHDMVVDQATALQVRTDILSFNTNAAVVGNIPGATHTLEQVLKGVSKKKLKSAQIRPPRARLIRLLVSTISVAVLTYVLATAWNLKQEHDRKAFAQELASATGLQRARLLAETNMGYTQTVKQIIRTKQESLRMGISPVNATKITLRAFNARPLYHLGWHKYEMDCDYDTKTCTDMWKMGPTGAHKDGLTIPGVLPISVPVDSLQTAPFPIEIAPSPLRPDTLDVYFTLASLKDLYSEGSGYHIDVKAPVPVKVQLPLVPVGITPTQAPAFGSLAPVTLGGNPYLVEAMAQKLGGLGVRVHTGKVLFRDNGTLDLLLDGECVLSDAVADGRSTDLAQMAGFSTNSTGEPLMPTAGLAPGPRQTHLQAPANVRAIRINRGDTFTGVKP